MEQPAMFMVGEKVCLLKRWLYGLRQARRVWFETLTNCLRSIGLTEFGAVVSTCHGVTKFFL